MLKYEIINEEELNITDDSFNELLDKNLRVLVELLRHYDFEVRIVGGAVRDILLGKKPRDVDLLTTATPDQVIFILSLNDIEADMWGIKHGTVKAVLDNEKYDITSLGFEMKQVGNHIKTKKSNDWVGDAKRRDFTINAMSMDENGHIWDYFSGKHDLENSIIRPLPDLDKKILLDPVIIYRFFRMLAKFENPRTTKRTFQLILKNKDLVKKVGDERTKNELDDIKKCVNGKKILQLMKRFKVI